MNDDEFMIDIIMRIVHYAENNGMSPDETLKIIAKNMLDLLEIATFENDKE